MRIRQQREDIAEKIVSGRAGATYTYFAPADSMQSPAVIVEPASPVTANFNVSNRMGDEWRWRVWVGVAIATDPMYAYDELDDLIYGDQGIRQILHHDDVLSDGKSRLIVTGVREYGLRVTQSTQTWLTAQVTVSVHTQG